MPVVTLEFFHNETREQINPLVSEDRMKMCVSALHDMGEVSNGKRRTSEGKGRGREREGGMEGWRRGDREGGREGERRLI